MAKRISFEELLQREFRWPRQGDQPFVAVAQALDNANIPDDEFQRRVLMIEGYKSAGDIMVDQSEREPHMRHTLVFPIIFNYRQFLELALKHQLAQYGPPVGVQPIWDNHRLDVLWESFQRIIQAHDIPDPDEADGHVATTVAAFAHIDPRSDAFRFPRDNRGRAIPLNRRDLHLPTLKDVMDGVKNYFAACDNYFG